MGRTGRGPPTKEDLLSEDREVEQVDPLTTGSVRDALRAMARMSFQARQLGRCLAVWERMLDDEDRPTVLLGVAGSLIAGGLRRVLSRLVEHGLVDVVVSAGSQPYQDLLQAMGHRHYRLEAPVDDVTLRELRIDRFYDTVVDDLALEDADRRLGQLIGKLEPRAYTTREVLAYLGDNFDDPDSFVVQAARRGVPVYAPAINDSSLGLGMVHGMLAAEEAGEAYPGIDPVRDAYELARIVEESPATGVVYLGGGVPKNYIQQSEALLELLGRWPGGHRYGLQLTTDAAHWGGLSGCTLAEAQSWGKVHEQARTAEARVDVTIGLPLLAAALLEERERWAGRPRLAFDWDGAGELRAVDHVAPDAD